DLILDVAEESLESLGYPLREKTSIIDGGTPQEEGPAPLSDPLQEIEVLAEEAVAFQPLEEELLPALELDDYFSSPALVESTGDLSDEFAGLPARTLVDVRGEDAGWSIGAAALDEPADRGSVADALVDSSDDLPTLELSVPEQDAEAIDFPHDESVPVLPAELLAEPEELTAESLPASWDELELDGLDLPEVELPSAPPAPVQEPVDQPVDLAQVMGAPVPAINPPAQNVPASLLPPPADEEPIDEDLLEVFIEEVGEVLETIHEYLPQWRADTANKDALSEVRRAFHTLKGSGRMVRALIIGELAWSIENMLNRVLDRSIQPEQPVQQVIVDVVALMPALLDEFAGKAQRQRDDVDRLADTAHALARGQVPNAVAEPVVVAAQVATEEHSAESLLPVGETAPDPVAAPVADEEDALDPVLLEIFRNEAETHLDTLAGFLADCARELPQPVTDALQRALHTLKGSAHMAGILPIAEIATPLEKLVKEFKISLLNMDLAEAELLQEAEQLLRAGLERLGSQPLAPIPGAAAFIERVQQLHQARLENAVDTHQGSQEERDPQLISIFLAEGMDILLDADDLLHK